MRLALEPLRTALLADARAEAERIEAEAHAEAAARVAAAEAEAAALVERARAEGEAAAELEVAHDRAEAQRHARVLRLAAQRAVYEELRRQTLAGAAALHGTARYRALLDRLRNAAQTQLGSEAHVEPAACGGVVGRSDGRSVDYSLDALVERALAGLGGDAAEVWR